MKYIIVVLSFFIVSCGSNNFYVQDSNIEEQNDYKFDKVTNSITIDTKDAEPRYYVCITKDDNSYLIYVDNTYKEISVFKTEVLEHSKWADDPKNTTYTNVYFSPIDTIEGVLKITADDNLLVSINENEIVKIPII